MANPQIVEFLRAVNGDRTNLDLLLVFSDWLEEQGDFRAEEIRQLVKDYQATPDYWKPTWAAEITMQKFMVFLWHPQIPQHYTRKRWDHRIKPFPEEQPGWTNAYLDVLTGHPLPPWC